MQQPELKVELGFVQRRLPWIVAAATLLLYLITLNHSATFEGMGSLAKAAGWDWRSNLVAPLHVILTYPIRWLPAGVQLIALNLTAAVCASLALALLARSVALLPHDRTREQRGVERSEYSLLTIAAAWVPPVLAALVCGLQLTFWENAVVATGEALDLLIFAWLIHCLLQYRLDEKESRLSWFALVYGLSITNNHAMIAFAPAFLGALVWIMGLKFFRLRFLLRLLALGVAGLLLYLLLPLLGSFNNVTGSSFWDLLKSYIGYQKNSILGTPRFIIFLCSLTSLLPVLFMGIRWPAQFGETSAIGNTITIAMTHLIHAIFLAACIYVAFDPPFSPRSLSGEMNPMLPLYYLGALAIGYCSGYLLLVFGAQPGPQAWQRQSPLRKALNLAVVALVWLALIAAPAGLAIKNLPTIWANTGQSMSRLAQAHAKALPEQGAIVLSDDIFQLYALQYELAKSQPNHKHVLVDTGSLVAGGYHRFLLNKHPDRWPKPNRPIEPKSMVDAVSLVEMLYSMSKNSPIYYLHPSFGYYFEYFAPKPRQTLFELTLYPTNQVMAPTLTAAEIKQQSDFWQSLVPTEIDPLIKKAVPFTKPKPGKDRPRRETLDTYLGRYYSRALNQFGVDAQRGGDLSTAGRFFELALRLNPANPAAFINRDANRAIAAGKVPDEKLPDEVVDRLKLTGGRWDAIMGLNGPVDDPGACYQLAQVFDQGGTFRQAAQNIERTIQLDPNHRNARLVSTLILVKAGFPDLALERSGDFRRRYPASTLSEIEEMELLRAEAWAHVLRNDLPTSEKLIASAQARYPQQSTPWETLVDIYNRLGQTTNAFNVLERQLQAQPNSSRALMNYAVLKGRMGKMEDGLPYIDRALQINPKDEDARYNRALIYQSIGRLDEAIQDFQALLGAGTTRHRVGVLYSIAEVYFAKKNRRESIRYYKDFLKAAPPGVPEIPAVKDRLKLLESGSAF